MFLPLGRKTDRANGGHNDKLGLGRMSERARPSVSARRCEWNAVASQPGETLKGERFIREAPIVRVSE